MSIIARLGLILLLLFGLFGWFIFSAWLMNWIEKHCLEGGE